MNKKASGFGIMIILVGIGVLFLLGIGFSDIQAGTHMIPGEQAYGPGISEAGAAEYRSTGKGFMVIGGLFILLGIFEITSELFVKD